MTFDEAFAKLIGFEAGYVNDPQDPGGETKYGISKRSYPREDIAALTLDRAKEIYRRDFWNKAGCEVVPVEIKYELFDCAANSGVDQAVKLLQRVVGTTEDGLLGPRTLRAAQSMHPIRLAARYLGRRLDFMNDLPKWQRFGRGWSQRVAELLEEI